MQLVNWSPRGGNFVADALCSTSVLGIANFRQMRHSHWTHWKMTTMQVVWSPKLLVTWEFPEILAMALLRSAMTSLF